MTARSTLLSMVFFASTSVLTAQAPPLPQLGPDADPRDARAYYNHGIEQVVLHPDSAAAAFYWASRLDPAWAEPWYARWAALHLSDMDRLYEYAREDEDVITSPEVIAIDSLYFRALQLDPFFYRILDYLWNEQWWREAVIRQFNRISLTNAELNYVLDSLLVEDTTQWVQAWYAYSERDFATAAKHYGALLRDPDWNHASVNNARGLIFVHMRQYDSASVSFENALELLRRRDESEFVVLYESKAMLEYMRGLVLERRGQAAAAADAYANALLEDLAFSPAHERLGILQLEVGDTVGAVMEFQLAAEVDPSSSVPRVRLAATFYGLGDYELAVEAVQAAIAVEPYYDECHYILALAQEALGDVEGAVVSYGTFLGLAKATDDRRDAVEATIERLKG